MRKISFTELKEKVQGYTSRQVEISFEFDNLPAFISTYQKFYFTEDYDYNTEDDVVVLQDGLDNQQHLYISKKQIREIRYLDDATIFGTVFSIVLDNCKIDFCLAENPIHCCKCKKVIEDSMETVWGIKGYGGYGSHFDGEELDIKLCDNCLYSLLYGEDGEINE